MARIKIIAASTVTRNVTDFEKFAQLIAPLKKHARVEISIHAQAEKTHADIPPGGSPWHEYTSMLATFQKFFPHKKMQPFLDMKHVKKNRDLLRAKAKVVKKFGYLAAFRTHIPFYLPEEFFAKYPHLRGAQCDHPRRTRREAFAMCVDHPEALEMIREMMAEFAREVPEISMMALSTNDAGAGLCWSDWLYPGPNGNAACKHIPTAQRVATLMRALREGAGKERVLDLQLDGNFSEPEQRELSTMVNESFHYHVHRGTEVQHQINVGSVIDNPVRGIFNPVAIIQILGQLQNPAVTRVGVHFGFNYHRGRELDDVVEKVVEIVDAFLKEPAYGILDGLTFLRKLCGKWVGEKRRDELLEAFIALHQAYLLKDAAARMLTGNYYGVSMRIVNRPLVILPQLLTPEEEAYFLPHVFNPDVQDARMDYRNWHGAVLEGGAVSGKMLNGDPRVIALDNFRESLRKIAATLEGMGDSPAGMVLRRMGISLRLYAGIMRSANNFFSSGVVRDRNQDKLLGPAHLPPKIGDWTGDPDLQLLNGYMRDELDNTADMIDLLENGGLRQMVLAANLADEDTFLLGPNLVAQLKMKSAIMRRHWTDAQSYMTIPHK